MPLRLIVQTMIRRRVKKRLQAQGFGRHTRDEQDRLAVADIEALATILGEKPFLMGERPCGADATVFGFVASILSPVFTSKVRSAAERRQNLTDYRDRILRQYFKS
jgi:glutathione S-transferase